MKTCDATCQRQLDAGFGSCNNNSISRRKNLRRGPTSTAIMWEASSAANVKSASLLWADWPPHSMRHWLNSLHPFVQKAICSSGTSQGGSGTPDAGAANSLRFVARVRRDWRTGGRSSGGNAHALVLGHDRTTATVFFHPAYSAFCHDLDLQPRTHAVSSPDQATRRSATLASLRSRSGSSST